MMRTLTPAWARAPKSRDETPIRRDMPGQIPEQVSERPELPAPRVKPDLMVGQERAAMIRQHPPPPRRIQEVPHLKPQLHQPPAPLPASSPSVRSLFRFRGDKHASALTNGRDWRGVKSRHCPSGMTSKIGKTDSAVF